jgi:hypothetical protein
MAPSRQATPLSTQQEPIGHHPSRDKHAPRPARPTDPFHASEPSSPDRWTPAPKSRLIRSDKALARRDTSQATAQPLSRAPRDAPEPDSP